jgi:hypothetical protein
MSIWQVAGVMGIGALIAVICVVLGSYISFKSAHAVPGEGFLGGVPKGQVFTIPEAESVPEGPSDEQAVLAKTERFLSMLGGKG